MALNTEAKRWSMLRASGPVASPIVFNPTGANADSQDERFTVLRIYGGSLSLAAPVFSGTIPTITGNEGDADVITDLSTYFSGATSYSISPAVEAGWNFDTVTGILTVDTDDAQTFGPFTVTGTNATGSDSSNAFEVIISAVSTEETNTGGWFWFKYEQEQLRKQEKRRQQEEKLKKAKQIQDKIDRELALAQRELEEKELREAELKTLTVLVEQFEDEIQQLTNERISQVAQEAIEQNTYSRMERLERELARYKEEEEFLLMATRIILNA